MVGGLGPSSNAMGRSSCRRSLAPRTGRRESRSLQRVRATGMSCPAEDARAASMRPPTGTSWRGWVGSRGRRSVRCRCGGRSPNTVADIGPGPRTHHASASCAAHVSKRASVSLQSRSSESARRAEPGSGHCALHMRRMRRGWTRRVPSRRSCLPRTPSTSCRTRQSDRSAGKNGLRRGRAGGCSWRRPSRQRCSSRRPSTCTDVRPPGSEPLPGRRRPRRRTLGTRSCSGRSRGTAIRSKPSRTRERGSSGRGETRRSARRTHVDTRREWINRAPRSARVLVGGLPR